MKKMSLLCIVLSIFSLHSMYDDYLDYLLNNYSEEQRSQDIIKWTSKKDDVRCEFCNQEGNEVPWINGLGVHGKCLMYVLEPLTPITNVLADHLDSLGKLPRYHHILQQSIINHLKQRQKNPCLTSYEQKELAFLFKIHGIRVLEEHFAKQEKSETGSLLEELKKMREEAEHENCY